MKVQNLIETNLLEVMDFSSRKEKEDFLQQYGEILVGRIIDRTTSLLEPQQLGNMTQKLEDGKDISEIFELLNEYVPHFLVIVGEESLDLKEETLGLVALTT